MQFSLKIDQTIFNRFPGYAALVLYVEGIQNGASDSFSTGLLREAEVRTRVAFGDLQVSDHPHIKAWRDAFTAFGAKAKRFPCGAEALLKRVVSGHSLPPISQVVDFYNTISLRHIIPVGGEDWSGLRSDLLLYPARGDEPFVFQSSGEQHVEYPHTGEIIWADTAGVTVRRWNWRQCTRTQITTDTRDCYFVFDRLEPFPLEALDAAAEDLIGVLRQVWPECQVRRQLMMKEQS
jgi:DNA/RNA-binding domain of Phe-tRNA-synthetase-like protein